MASFGLALVALDPRGHEGKRLRVEVDRLSVAVANPDDESGVLEHAQVLGHSLLGDVQGRCELSDRRIAGCESSDELATGRVSRRREYLRQCIRRHGLSLVAQHAGSERRERRQGRSVAREVPGRLAADALSCMGVGFEEHQGVPSTDIDEVHGDVRRH
jgi:hypothetical protein